MRRRAGSPRTLAVKISRQRTLLGVSADENHTDRWLGVSLGHPSDAQRFTALWDAYAHRIQAYSMRHVDAETAQEVVSETFLVAWRRLRDVPGEPLPWLIVVARNTIANDRRSKYRARTLAAELQRLAAVAPSVTSGAEAEVVERETMLRGLAALTVKEREALLLIAWDGLSAADAATVAGCSTTALHVRIHRARRRLAGLVDEPPARDPALTPRQDRRSQAAPPVIDLAPAAQPRLSDASRGARHDNPDS